MALILNLEFSLKNYINSLLFCGLFFSLKTSAFYHSGNITYKWLHGYTYEIKYSAYTTDSLDHYCQIDSICFGDGVNGALQRVNGPIATCSPAHDGVSISSTIRWNEYVAVHSYPGPGNYVVCFKQPTRNPGIINLPNSVNQDMAFESMLVIPGFTSGKNDSPVFVNHPMAYGCLNNGCFTYNPMATDVDGDSLSFKLIPCLGVPGFAYPATGAGGTFNINSVTGLLTWCKPQFSGDYNVGIKIEEWRKNDDGDYFLIGYVIRDTQFSIDNCTGISDVFEKEQAIAIYPNPTTNHIEINFKETSDELYTIDITDVTGKIVTRLLENSNTKPSMKFDVNELGRGIYFIRITTNNKTTVKKLIKQ